MKRPLSEVARRLKPAVFSELQARIDRLVARGGELIALQIGDSHLLPPAAARRALAGLDADDTSLYRYGSTAGLTELRAAMSAALASRGVVRDAASEILLGNGGTHALFCAAKAILEPGDDVLMAAPYWPLAPGVITACGARPIDVDLTQSLYRDPTLDPLSLLTKALTPRTRALYFSSPNNPDGKVLTVPQLERMAAFAREHDLWVVADEVYADIVFSEETPPSIASLEGMRDRTLTVHSLSKSHALAGLRVGFVSAPERVVAAARRISTHSAFNVSVAMQRAALAAFSDEVFTRQARDAYRHARDEAVRALDGAPVDFQVAEGATYLFVDFAPAIALRGLRTERPVYEILERAVDRGVLLAPGDAFGRAYAGSFARLCFTAAPPATVVRGIERLRDAIDAFVGGRP